MRKRQEISATVAFALLIFAAGVIETNPGAAFALLAAMVPVMMFGRLGTRRVSVRDIVRRWRNAP